MFGIPISVWALAGVTIVLLLDVLKLEKRLAHIEEMLAPQLRNAEEAEDIKINILLGLDPNRRTSRHKYP